MNEQLNWFAPKRFGIGAGLPIAWQGWALLGGYMAALAICVVSWGGHDKRTIAAMIPLTIVLVVISWRTTRGGWRWRWGEED